MLTRVDAEALVPVVSGRQMLYVEVEREADIRQVLRFKRANPRIQLVLVGASEGWLMAEEIAAANVPVIAERNLPAIWSRSTKFRGLLACHGAKHWPRSLRCPPKSPVTKGNLV